MPNKKKVIKSINNIFLTLFAISAITVQAQENSRKKIDGVVAVIGDFVVLESDIDKAYVDLKNQGINTSEIKRCQLLGNLMETKLYTHHAIQDSIPVPDAQIDAQVNQRIDYMKQNLGSEEKILKFYRKDNMTDFKKELGEVLKNQALSSKMQEKIVEEVAITPDEVKQFFKSIPKDDRPEIGTEIEMSQIVIKPKPDVSAVKEVEDRLNSFRNDVLKNGASFATKAVLYSQDPGSRSTGGKYVISRKDPFAKEFKEAAFRLQEGEVSKPFKTDFGYHIVTVDKILGQKREVRHILLVPEISSEVLNKYKSVSDSLRKSVLDKKITFISAAQQYSDEKETRADGGIVINPVSGDKRFELTKLDPILYEQVSDLEEGGISKVLGEQDRQGNKFFKIIKIDKKIPDHIADFGRDYIKIQELALKEKKLKAIKKWQKEKIIDTYIKVSKTYNGCEFQGGWVKK